MFFLKSQAGLRQMEQRMTGGLYPAIIQDELENIMVPLPGLALQEEIISIITKEQKNIVKEKEELGILKEQRKNVIEAFFAEMTK
jgi:restriction endonuclease S subunit